MAEFIPYALSLRQLAAQHPDKDALIVLTPEQREAYSYGQYDAKVDAFAGALAGYGVDAHSGVIIVSPNSAAAVIASSAAWRLGAFVAPISFKSTQTDLGATINAMAQSKAKIFVLSDHVKAQANALNIALEALHAAPASSVADGPIAAPARAIPSGGTTGRAKLIVDETLWGRNSDAIIFKALDRFGWSDAQRILVYSPLYHNVGQTLTHLALMQGQTAVLMDRFDAARAQETIRKEAIEFFFAVPTHMQRWLDLPNLSSRHFSTVKSMYHAGAVCPRALKQKWLDFLGPERVWELYGATDGSGLTVIRGDEWLSRIGSVGQAFMSDIAILDDAQVPVAGGETGQIYMRTHGASVGAPGFRYLGADLPPATADGFRSVGDMGRLDADGYLYIADRRTDMIITGGANVFPAEVEAVLKRHPQVRDAAVVGLPDKKWGRRVHAIVVPREPAAPPTSQDIDRFMAEQIVGYKKPKTYAFRSALLYTDVDKLDRKRLIAEALEETPV